MKLIRFLSPFVAMLALVAGVNAADQKTEKTTTELKAQTRCPVMGGAIDSTAFTDIQGQRVYHCCPGCQEKLVADPDKYFKKAAAQGVLFENIQTTCPVSGEVLEDKEVYSDYEGRRIYFCCKKCQKQFAESPQKFLNAMDAPPKEKPSSKDHSVDDHSNHTGH